MAQEPHHTPRVTVEDQLETVTVRRVPKHSVFMVLGAVLGVVVAAILTFAFPGTQQPSATGVEYSAMQVFGFLALAGIAVGLAVGAVVALILERVIGRRTRQVRADHEHVQVEDD